jgi:cysteine-rich repeat protein
MHDSRFAARHLNFALVSAVSVAAMGIAACSSEPGCDSCSTQITEASAGADGDAPPFLLPRETPAGGATSSDATPGGAGGVPGETPPDDVGGEAGSGGSPGDPETELTEGGMGGETSTDVPVAAEPEPSIPEPRCGDRLVDAGEECDDGNEGNDDECTSECRRPMCGDGFTFLRLEQCDDANSDDTDACRNNCKMAKCGDAVVQAGVEDCDDGNQIETDDCLATCKAPKCGDAFVQTGKEECDDANTATEDACIDCKLAKCGDGTVWQDHEQCDDGNANSGDGCSPDCTAEPLALSLGAAHSCAVFGDGRLKCWGDNTYGQVGSAVDSSVGDDQSELGEHLEALLEHVDAVATGSNHTCALQDGAVKCWGDNSSGQLGPQASGTLSRDPVPVTLGEEATALCATAYSSFALLANGTVKGWGINYNETLSGLWTAPFGGGVRALACGTSAVCALSDRGVECWGASALTSARPTPMLVTLASRESSNITQLSHGSAHACAVFANGNPYCWGKDTQGQRLTGEQEDLRGDIATSSPWTRAPLNMKVKAIAAGGGSSCAIGTEASRDVLKCWGYDSRTGALGQPDLTSVATNHIGDTAEEVAELSPISLGSGAVPRIVATSGFHTCVILTNGGTKCWGDNSSGQLAIGTDDSAIGDEQGEMGEALRYSSID